MIRSLTVLALSLGLSLAAQAKADPYFELQAPTVTEIADDYSNYAALANGLNKDCSQGQKFRIKYSDEVATNSVGADLALIDLVLDQVLNIGKKVFTVVDQGRAVVNMTTDVAYALPGGLTCWSDLGGWKTPNSSLYNIVYKNKLGMTVVDFTYRLIFTAGGSADGVGRYVANATILPAKINVAWGFDFSVVVKIPSVYNQGTRSNPIGAMQMDIGWTVKSPVAHEQRTESYFVNGLNQVKKL